MNLHEALAKLAPTKSDSFITRPGGPTVRNAVGQVEQAQHRFVTATDPVEGFDASPEDIWVDPDDKAKGLRDDWSLRSRTQRLSDLRERAAASAPAPLDLDEPVKPVEKGAPSGKAAK